MKLRSLAFATCLAPLLFSCGSSQPDYVIVKQEAETGSYVGHVDQAQDDSTTISFFNLAFLNMGDLPSFEAKPEDFTVSDQGKSYVSSYFISEIYYSKQIVNGVEQVSHYITARKDSITVDSASSVVCVGFVAALTSGASISFRGKAI